MLTNCFSFYKLNNTSNPQPPSFHEEKNHKKDGQIMNVIKVLGYLNIGIH